MVTLHDQIECISMIVMCACLTCAAFSLSFFYLPFRFLQSLLPPKPPTSPKATITVHPPSTTPKDTVVLVHGFPDSPAMFKDTISHLTEGGYRCLAVALPGSTGEPVPKPIPCYEVAEQIRTALREHTTEPVALVAHDWGSFYSLILLSKYPDLFSRTVLLDVGNMSNIDLLTILTIATYQGMFALMYILGDLPATLITRFFLQWAQYTERHLSEVNSDMCYHYYSIFKLLLTRPQQGNKFKTGISATTNIPKLFIYGGKKPMMFHDAKWLSHVRSTPHGEVVELPVGHWVTSEDRTCNEKIRAWLDKTLSKATST